MSIILIIDDEQPLRRVMRSALERRGHVVLDVSDGREGVALLRQTSPDLIVTDIFMPEKDGIQVLQDVNQMMKKPKVIVITGGDPRDLFGLKSSAKFLGAARVLSKPFDLQKFQMLVEEVLQPKQGTTLMAAKADIDDQRKFPRFPVTFPVSFGDAMHGRDGMVVDISPEGCRIRSADGLPGEKYFWIGIELEKAVERLEVDLAVMRWSNLDQFGVEFIRMVPEQQVRLRRVIQGCVEAGMPSRGIEGALPAIGEAGQ